MADKNTTLTQSETSMAERFTGMVMKQYSTTGKYQPTEREKQLIRNYFICIDQTLQKGTLAQERQQP